jgi:glycosyltransferase involved in cell wall biosynthesis
MSATVSVALCTRNGAAHIEQQLRSVLAQTTVPDEVVVSDDASSDETLAIVRRVFATLDGSGMAPRLTIIENAHPLGVTANFEQAILACTGDLVALCDQDDVWHPNRVGAVLRKFEHAPDLELVYSDARLVDENGEPLGYSLFEALEVDPKTIREVELGQAFAALLKRNLVTGATTMLRRDLAVRAAPFPEPWVHDEWLAVIAAVTGQLDLVPETLIDYRQHASNQIGVRKLGPVAKVRRLFEPRADRYGYLLDRSNVLLNRVIQLGDRVSPEYLELAAEKVDHQRARATLPAGRLRRWIPVLREARTGRYRRFSRGFADVLRDLVQQAGA